MPVEHVGHADVVALELDDGVAVGPDVALDGSLPCQEGAAEPGKAPDPALAGRGLFLGRHHMPSNAVDYAELATLLAPRDLSSARYSAAAIRHRLQ